MSRDELIEELKKCPVNGDVSVAVGRKQVNFLSLELGEMFILKINRVTSVPGISIEVE